MRNHPETLAVIAAAGSSSRMSGTDKLFADLCGKPVLVHTLENYAHASFVDAIIVVTRKYSIQTVQELIENWHIGKIHAVILKILIQEPAIGVLCEVSRQGTFRAKPSRRYHTCRHLAAALPGHILDPLTAVFDRIFRDADVQVNTSILNAKNVKSHSLVLQ